jgi:ferredoxin
MPHVVIHKDGQTLAGDVQSGTNLVVRAGIKQFPWPMLAYGCGMGRCGRCASRVIAGAEHLPEPNYKEVRVLGDRLGEGYRLACQLWVEHDLEIEQLPVPPVRPSLDRKPGGPA